MTRKRRHQAGSAPAAPPPSAAGSAAAPAAAPGVAAGAGAPAVAARAGAADAVAPTGAAAGRAATRDRRRRWIAAALALLAVAAAIGWWAGHAPLPNPPPPAASPATAAAGPAADYVDNRRCLGCHEAPAAAWAGSHHAHAMAPATPATVRGDFADASFRHQGVTTRFFRRGDRFFVRTDGPDGRLADFELKFTFGVAPLQQYLIETAGGRLQPLQIAWNTQAKQWFHLLPHEKAPPGDVLHWTGRYQTANTMCITCHTAAADRFDSRWHEPNVSCQSCHGPGSRHVEWAERQAAGDAAAAAAIAQRGLAADTKTPRAQVEICAACHSRRSELTPRPVPGEPHLDHYLPALLREGLYHADGQQLDEVFVVGSFRQSRMYRMGVACTNCHDPHAAKPKLPGNALCLQCHDTKPNAAFPGAAGGYDTLQHHHHAPGSAGAQCTACHMPAKNYMIVQPRPDHSLRIPRPDLSVTLGTPNAARCSRRPGAAAAMPCRRWRHWPPTRRSRRSCAPPRSSICAASPSAWTCASPPRAMPTPSCAPPPRRASRTPTPRSAFRRWRRC